MNAHTHAGMNPEMSFGEHVWRNDYLRGLILCFRKKWTANEAAEYGLMPVFVELGHELGCGFSRKPAVLAIQHGHLPVLQWLHANGYDIAIPFDALDLAAKYGQLHIAQWLHDLEYGPDCFALTDAAAGGHADVVRWLLQTFPHLVGKEVAMFGAMERGHSTVVRMLHSTPCSTECRRLLQWAAMSGRLCVVEWVHKHCTGFESKDAMRRAANAGHLHVVQWLHETRPHDPCTTQVMDAAASGGHLHIVEWLQNNRTEGCTHRAMDEAARCGHLHVVKWLHTNRNEGCTAYAMNQAARNGHMHIVQWLHANRTEGFDDDDAINMAELMGHVFIADWLRASRKRKRTGDDCVQSVA